MASWDLYDNSELMLNVNVSENPLNAECFMRHPFAFDCELCHNLRKIKVPKITENYSGPIPFDDSIAPRPVYHETEEKPCPDCNTWVVMLRNGKPAEKVSWCKRFYTHEQKIKSNPIHWVKRSSNWGKGPLPENIHKIFKIENESRELILKVNSIENGVYIVKKHCVPGIYMMLKPDNSIYEWGYFKTKVFVKV